jgi:lysine 6-dehydrogenase
MSNSQNSLVLGSGIVGRAAAWDLQRRGHQVTIVDANPEAAQCVGKELDVPWQQLDVTDAPALTEAMVTADAVISAVPYLFGEHLATHAIKNGCHYFDFGGNPTIVKQQLKLDTDASSADVAIVPDCGLAPGLANVLAAGLIEKAPSDHVDNVQIRVGVLPQEPIGTLRYQLAFYAGGLINEYAEPCEIIHDGAVTTVDPLTRFEEIDWAGDGLYLEAFSTAGGTSTMCHDYAGRVNHLEYKTLRFPGHGRIFAAMRELGLFDTTERAFGDATVAPRTVLLDLLTERLPSGTPDVTLVGVSVSAAGYQAEVGIEDVDDGRFSSLARTTAFPTTALCDLITRGEVGFRGAAAMHSVAPADLLVTELSQVGIQAQAR